MSTEEHNDAPKADIAKLFANVEHQFHELGEAMKAFRHAGVTTEHAAPKLELVSNKEHVGFNQGIEEGFGKLLKNFAEHQHEAIDHALEAAREAAKDNLKDQLKQAYDGHDQGAISRIKAALKSLEGAKTFAAIAAAQSVAGSAEGGVDANGGQPETPQAKAERLLNEFKEFEKKAEADSHKLDAWKTEPELKLQKELEEKLKKDLEEMEKLIAAHASPDKIAAAQKNINTDVTGLNKIDETAADRGEQNGAPAGDVKVVRENIQVKKDKLSELQTTTGELQVKTAVVNTLDSKSTQKDADLKKANDATDALFASMNVDTHGAAPTFPTKPTNAPTLKR